MTIGRSGMVALIFVSHFGTLALSFWPYIIPFRHHHRRSGRAAVQSHVHFWGGVVVLSTDAALHAHQLQRLQRQGRNHSWISLNFHAKQMSLCSCADSIARRKASKDRHGYA